MGNETFYGDGLIMIRFGSPKRDLLSKGDMTHEKGLRSQHSKDVQLRDSLGSPTSSKQLQFTITITIIIYNYNLQFTIYNLQFTIYNLQFAICNLQFAICNLQFTIYNLQFAITITITISASM